MRILSKSEGRLLVASIILGGLILLYEGGLFGGGQSALIAGRPLNKPLVLVRGENIVTIPTGDWIVALDRQKNIIFSGILAGADEDTILIEDTNLNIIEESTSRVATLYHGKAFQRLHSTKQGLKNGFRIGSIAGLTMGLIEWARCGFPIDGFVPAVAGGILIGNYFGLPIGTGIGLLTGLANHGQAIKYEIGPDQWQIVVE